MHPYHHALSSAKKYGGKPEDYYPFHSVMDSSKFHEPTFKHRVIFHTSLGIYLAQQVFGFEVVNNSDGKQVPVTYLAEQHIFEDLGFIPSLSEALKDINILSGRGERK